MGLFLGNICWFWGEASENPIHALDNPETRESGIGVMWHYIILNVCVTNSHKHVKRCSASSVIKHMHIKTPNTATHLKPQWNSHQNGYKEKYWQYLLLTRLWSNWKTPRSQIDCKVIWPLFKTNWQYLLKQNIFFLYIISTLDAQPKKFSPPKDMYNVIYSSFTHNSQKI